MNKTFDPAEFSDRVAKFIAGYVPPERWRAAGAVLAQLLVDVSRETAALASEQWAVGIAEAKADFSTGSEGG
jgi:hypothetical protein